ncbi:unnamed protein product [Cladocopium goreaui]|uniref:Ankyrin repeat domain-containing protein 50 n=1 Tax=Cladocopium goreaui TaxID=2562237 RepID=A0A9P1DB13_9DINO|nr:unnamed protein product [Cladocopium goreaui]
MYFAMSNKYRNIDDRAHACTAFEQVFNMVASILGGFALEHVPIGSQDNQVLDLLVDTGGRVDSSNLWTQDFYARYARGAWAKDFQSEQKTWVTTRHGVGRISLAQFLCFSCDPQHNVDLRGKLSRELFNLLSEFGRLLDETVSLMSKDVKDLDDHLAMACKNQGRVSRSAKTEFLLISDAVRELPRNVRKILRDARLSLLAMVEHYNITQLFVSPADQGHSGVARDRTYLVLTLKDKVTQVHDVEVVYRKVSTYIRQRVQTRPSDYLIATKSDLLRDAQYCANKRGKPFPKQVTVKNTWNGKRFSLKRLLNLREAQGVKFALAKYQEVKQEVFDAAKSQYERRSEPMAHTAWGPTEIARFMRWQLSLFKEGKIKRQHVGGFSYRLPQKSKLGEPAEMPDTVLEFEKKQAKKKAEAKRKVSSSDTGESDQENEEDEGEESEEIVDYELQAW